MVEASLQESLKLVLTVALVTQAAAQGRANVFPELLLGHLASCKAPNTEMLWHMSLNIKSKQGRVYLLLCQISRSTNNNHTQSSLVPVLLFNVVNLCNRSMAFAHRLQVLQDCLSHMCQGHLHQDSGHQGLESTVCLSHLVIVQRDHWLRFVKELKLQLHAQGQVHSEVTTAGATELNVTQCDQHPLQLEHLVWSEH